MNEYALRELTERFNKFDQFMEAANIKLDEIKDQLMETKKIIQQKKEIK